jgi:hypothetical protein
LPDAPNLVSIEFADNKLPGSELKNLLKYKQLKSIKFAANNVKEFGDIEVLKELEEITIMDFTANPISDHADYKDRIFSLFPKLIALDGFDKEGNEFLSEDEDEDYGNEGDDEEGEEQFDDDGDDDEFGEEDLEDDGDEEYGDYDDEDDEAGLGKRDRDDDSEDAPQPKK